MYHIQQLISILLCRYHMLLAFLALVSLAQNKPWHGEPVDIQTPSQYVPN